MRSKVEQPSPVCDHDLLSGGWWVESVKQTSKLLVTICDGIKALRHVSVSMFFCPFQDYLVVCQTSCSANVVFSDWNILSFSHPSTHLKASGECNVFYLDQRPHHLCEPTLLLHLQSKYHFPVVPSLPPSLWLPVSVHCSTFHAWLAKSWGNLNPCVLTCQYHVCLLC